jgi:hypothetical protein
MCTGPPMGYLEEVELELLPVEVAQPFTLEPNAPRFRGRTARLIERPRSTIRVPRSRSLFQEGSNDQV